MKRAIGVLTLCLLVPPSNLPRQAAQPQTAIRVSKPVKSDKEERGLHGPVETIGEEWCGLSDKPDKSGKYREEKHYYVCTRTFDISGKQILYDPPLGRCLTNEMILASQRSHCKYDENGNEIEVTVTDLNGRLRHKYVYAYDSRGNCTETAGYNSEGKLDYKWVTKFDENGNELETTRYGWGGVYQFKDVRVYNDKGLVIELTHLTNDPSLNSKTITTYEYDSYGNWIKSIDSKLVLENGKTFFKPDRVDYRIITYYSETGSAKSRRKTKEAKKTL